MVDFVFLSILRAVWYKVKNVESKICLFLIDTLILFFFFFYLSAIVGFSKFVSLFSTPIVA